MKTFYILLLALLTGLKSAAAAPAEATKPIVSDYLTVTYSVYSGMPNPCYYITDQNLIATILAKLTALPKHGRLARQNESVTPSQFGYRGFTIENHSTQHSEICAVRIYGSDVELWLQQPSADGATLSVVKDFRAEASVTATEAILFKYALDTGVLDEKLIRQFKAVTQKAHSP